MSLGKYIPGDPSLFEMTPEKYSYVSGESVFIALTSHHEKIRRVKVRIYPASLVIPEARELPRPIDTASDHLDDDGTGKVKFRIGRRLPPGKYQLVANTPKEAWLGDISGLLFFSQFEVT